jgi:mitochondrial fission protein ELM1
MPVGIGDKRVWILECHRAGDHAQCVGLAHAIGWGFEVKHIAYTWYELLPNMLIESGLIRSDASLFGIEAGLLGIDRNKSSEFAPPWPDLVISAGRRNEVAAEWVGRKSGGRTKVVLVGRTWTAPGKADLVIATPQYRLPPHPNQLINELPMHIVDETAQARGAAVWGPRWASLPRPWIAVFVGGTSGPYIFDAATGDRLAWEVAAVARETGGSLLVTTSARTPKSVLRSLEAASDVPMYVHEWRRGNGENPYPALLALADRFIVTGDSMSMLAEAASTQKPLQIFEFGSGLVPMHGPWSTSRRMRLTDWFRQRPSTLVNALFISLSPFKLNRSRDIRIMQDILLRSRRGVWLGEDMTRLRPSPTMDLERAVKRVKALFSAEESAVALRNQASAPRESVDQMAFGEPVQPARKARTRVG